MDILDKRDEKKAEKLKKQSQGGGDWEVTPAKRKRSDPEDQEGFRFDRSMSRERKKTGNNEVEKNTSDTTLYQPAVVMYLDRTRDGLNNLQIEPQKDRETKRGSSSSEDFIDTSDELDKSPKVIPSTNRIDNFISDIRWNYEHEKQDVPVDPQPHSSRQYGRNEITPEDHAADIICQTEKAKVRILTVPSEENNERLNDITKIKACCIQCWLTRGIQQSQVMLKTVFGKK